MTMMLMMLMMLMMSPPVFQVSSRLYSSPEAPAGPHIRSWLAESSGGRCVSVGAESQHSQVSEKIPRLEEISVSRLGKHRRERERAHRDIFQPPLSPAEDSVASEVKQKLALLTSSSSEELLSEVFNIDDNMYDSTLQRSSSVSDYLASGDPSVYLPRRRHSLTTLKDDPEPGGDQKEEPSETTPTTWLKVKNILYKRRESLKKKSFSKEVERNETKNKSTTVSSPSDCEFIDIIRPTPEQSEPSASSSIPSKKKAKSKNPELGFCNPDLLESKQFSQSLNSIKVDSTSTDNTLLSPKRAGEETHCHSLPSSPRAGKNTEDVFFYEEDLSQEHGGTPNLNISADSRDFQQMEAVR